MPESSDAGTVATDIEKRIAPFLDVQERMKSLAAFTGGGAALSRMAKQIAEQDRAIAAFRKGITEQGRAAAALREQIAEQGRVASAFRKGMSNQIKTLSEPKLGIGNSQVPDIYADTHRVRVDIPPHPAHETNQRLERIEERFEHMQEIAAKAAAIATGLQAYAAEFLSKFEIAAAANSRSAKGAIRLSVLAVIIALAMPSIQIAYTEFWRVPDESTAMQAVIADMKTEIIALRDAKALTFEQLAAALIESDRETASVLRSIGAMRSRTSVEVPEPTAPSE